MAPDMVTLAKGVASAYMPISCTVTTEEVFSRLQGDGDRLGYFRDISTYGGCAGGPVAALENLHIIEREQLLDRVVEMGAYFKAGLEEFLVHPQVGDVRGMGLLLGMEFVVDKASKTPLPEEKLIQLCSEMAARGVLVGRTNRSFADYNNTMTFAPAYIITKDDINTILSTLHEVIELVL